MIYDIGDVARIAAVFTDLNGNPVDPTTITLLIQDPANNQTTPAPSHDSTGNFHYDLTTALAGTYTYRWTGTGAATVVIEGSIIVEATSVVSQPPRQTAGSIIYSAYRIAGILRAPRRGLSQSEILDGVDCLNSLLDSWSAERLNIFTINAAIYTLTVNQQSYTIGIDPTGVLTANFSAPRPAKIRNANILTQVGGAQVTRVPLELLNDDGWASIRVRNTGSSIPQKLYDDYNDPLSTLSFYPFPNAAAQVEIFSWQALQQVASAADPFTVPPSYRRAVEYNLALELAPRYPQFPMNQRTIAAAMEAKSALQALNAPEPVMSCDLALLSGKKSTFNYLIGE